MKTILVDDEQDSLDILQEYLRKDSPEVKIVGTARRLAAAKQLIEEEQPDLILFDIQMEEEEKANTTSFELIEVLEKAGKLTFDIIFVTAHPRREYMQQAFDSTPVKFITKPVNRQELRDAIQKALKRLSDRTTFAREIEQLLSSGKIPYSPVALGIIAIPRLNGELEMIPLDDISYISTWQHGRMTHIHLQGQEKPLVCDMPIAYFKKMLVPLQLFFEISQSCIINLKALKSYFHPERTVRLNNGEVLYATQDKGIKLRKFFLNGQLSSKDDNHLHDMKPSDWVWKLSGKNE